MSKKSPEEDMLILEKSLAYAMKVKPSEDFWNKLPGRIRADNLLAEETEKRGEPGPEVFLQTFTL